MNRLLGILTGCSRMIGRTAIQALKALLALAQEPSQWLSVNDLAAAQALPAPYLEQLLLRLIHSHYFGAIS